MTLVAFSRAGAPLTPNHGPDILPWQGMGARQCRLRDVEQFSENVHFITTAAFLRKLEIEGIIDSFDDVWAEIVQKNSSSDPKIHRVPNPIEIDAPTRSGGLIFPPQ